MAARSQRTFMGLEKTVDGNYWGNACRIFGPTDRLALGRTACLQPTASMAVSRMKSMITLENPVKVDTH